MQRKTLVVIAPVHGTRDADGSVRLSRKFVEGMRAYQRLWSGDVWALLAPGADPSGNLDLRPYAEKALGFHLHMMPFDDEAAVARWLLELNPHVVLSGADYRMMSVHSACGDYGIPFVCYTEYSLKSHLQLIRAEGGNPLSQAKRMAWITHHMAREALIVRAAAAVQSNGTPTYDLYRHLNANHLLYFDSRTRESMLATEEEVRQRVQRVRQQSRPLRLLFSGRLNAMKGADHLSKVAQALQRRGVDFELDVCGDGVLKKPLEKAVKRAGLTERVRIMGVIDFETELVPHAREHTDLFVCTHRQGDPSCTYLETAGCGVPIVGYQNEAFNGILRRHVIGASSPMGDPDILAARIQELQNDPERLASMAEAGLRFARANTFEQTFRHRIEQLSRVARREAPQPEVRKWAS